MLFLPDLIIGAESQLWWADCEKNYQL